MKNNAKASMLISIIIPTYNVENYIEECVHSAFAQTYRQIEVICIDNSSTDHTWQKLEQLKTKYPPLIIDKELKPGAPAARNKGLKLSRGNWLQFLDADDLLKPKKLEHQVSSINNSSLEVPFIAAACIKRNINGDEIKVSIIEVNPFMCLFNGQLGNTCANLWNRQYIEKINGWDEALRSSQEADLMFRLLQLKDKVLFDNEPLTIIRERPDGQISQQDYSNKWERYFQKRLEMLYWIRANRFNLFSQYKLVFYDSLFGTLKILSNSDYNKAVHLYNLYLKGHYQPTENQKHSTRTYILLYKLLGFRGAEIIRRHCGKK